MMENKSHEELLENLISKFEQKIQEIVNFEDDFYSIVRAALAINQGAMDKAMDFLENIVFETNSKIAKLSQEFNIDLSLFFVFVPESADLYAIIDVLPANKQIEFLEKLTEIYGEFFEKLQEFKTNH